MAGVLWPHAKAKELGSRKDPELPRANWDSLRALVGMKDRHALSRMILAAMVMLESAGLAITFYI